MCFCHMKEKKLPFKAYTVMNNDIIREFSCIDTYRIYVLSLTCDIKTNTTDTTIDQLADLCNESVENYKSQKTKRSGKEYIKKSFTDKLRECKHVQVFTKSYGSKGKRNTYVFKQPLYNDTFRMIGKEIYNLDIDNKLKGYLIKLYSLANTNTLLVNKNIRDIKELINISNTTFSNYNRTLKDKGYIDITDKGIKLTVSGITEICNKPKATEATQDTLKAYANTLHDRVTKYNAYNKTGLQVFNLTNKDIKDLKLNQKLGIFAHYYRDNFKDIYNINSFVGYLNTGKQSNDIFRQSSKEIELEQLKKGFTF